MRISFHISINITQLPIPQTVYLWTSNSALGVQFRKSYYWCHRPISLHILVLSQMELLVPHPYLEMDWTCWRAGHTVANSTPLSWPYLCRVGVSGAASWLCPFADFPYRTSYRIWSILRKSLTNPPLVSSLFRRDLNLASHNLFSPRFKQWPLTWLCASTLLSSDLSSMPAFFNLLATIHWWVVKINGIEHDQHFIMISYVHVFVYYLSLSLISLLKARTLSDPPGWPQIFVENIAHNR